MTGKIDVAVEGLVEPFAVGFDRAGAMYVVEMEGGERVRKIDPRGVLTTVAGTGVAGFSGDGGPAARAQIHGAHHLLVLPDGEILLADTFNQRVRRIEARTGLITTLAGTGVAGFSGDGGPAAAAQFGGIYCLALSPKGERLYLCDLDNRRIREMDRKTGTVTTAVGSGRRGVPDDGTDARSAPLADPRAVAVDSKGDLYILERGGDALRVVGAEGKVRTLLGKPGPEPAIGPLKGPKHLCIDRRDRVYIADTENHRILRYDPRAERLERVAAGLSLNRPHGVFIRGDGVLFIADSGNGRIVKVAP